MVAVAVLGDLPGVLHQRAQAVVQVRAALAAGIDPTFEPLMEHEVNGLDYRYVYGNDRLSVNITLLSPLELTPSTILLVSS